MTPEAGRLRARSLLRFTVGIVLGAGLAGTANFLFLVYTTRFPPAAEGDAEIFGIVVFLGPIVGILCGVTALFFELVRLATVRPERRETYLVSGVLSSVLGSYVLFSSMLLFGQLFALGLALGAFLVASITALASWVISIRRSKRAA